MKRGKGWHGEPARHAAAARGIKTKKLDYKSRKEIRDSSDFLNFGEPGFELSDDWNDLDLIEEKLASASIKEVPMSRIWTWQDRISPYVVNLFVGNIEGGGETEPVQIIYDSGTGKYWVYEGNHRIVALKMLGRQKVKARVVDLRNLPRLS